MANKENWRASHTNRPRPLACKAILADLLNIAREQNCAVVGVPKVRSTTVVNMTETKLFSTPIEICGSGELDVRSTTLGKYQSLQAYGT